MFKFEVEFDIKFIIVELLELELILEEFLIELSKDKERDISPIEEDFLSLLNG